MAFVTSLERDTVLTQIKQHSNRQVLMDLARLAVVMLDMGRPTKLCPTQKCDPSDLAVLSLLSWQQIAFTYVPSVLKKKSCAAFPLFWNWPNVKLGEKIFATTSIASIQLSIFFFFFFVKTCVDLSFSMGKMSSIPTQTVLSKSIVGTWDGG